MFCCVCSKANANRVLFNIWPFCSDTTLVIHILWTMMIHSDSLITIGYRNYAIYIKRVNDDFSKNFISNQMVWEILSRFLFEMPLRHIHIIQCINVTGKETAYNIHSDLCEMMMIRLKIFIHLFYVWTLLVILKVYGMDRIK